MKESNQVSEGVGAPLLSQQRSRYFRLMRQEMNNVQACRTVGISHKTGTRWRLGRTEHKHGQSRTYAPVGSATIAPISSRFLSEYERIRIADPRRLGWTIRAIAADLGRAPSTVSRELTRNSPSDSPAYLPHHAHRAAAVRRGRPKASKLALDAELRALVAARLTKRWSPEQISHALRAEYPDQPWRHLPSRPSTAPYTGPETLAWNVTRRPPCAPAGAGVGHTVTRASAAKTPSVTPPA
jgi:hypothetical protein